MGELPLFFPLFICFFMGRGKSAGDPLFSLSSLPKRVLLFFVSPAFRIAARLSLDLGDYSFFFLF